MLFKSHSVAACQTVVPFLAMSIKGKPKYNHIQFLNTFEELYLMLTEHNNLLCLLAFNVTGHHSWSAFP